MPHNCPHCKAEIKPNELGLVPTERLTEETQKRTVAEAAAQTAQSELTKAQTALKSTNIRLSLAGDRVVSEKHARQVSAAYEADIEGVEKPPTLAEWLQGDGKIWGQALNAAQAPLSPQAPQAPPATSPAQPAQPQPQPQPPATPPAAPPPPNTNPGTLPATPGPGLTPAQYATEADRLSRDYARARTTEEKNAINQKKRDLDARFNQRQQSAA